MIFWKRRVRPGKTLNGSTWNGFGIFSLALLVGCGVVGCGTASGPEIMLAQSATESLTQSERRLLVRRPAAGDVIGTTGLYGGLVWRGIPYAEPPMGDLRFRAPVPASHWDGEKDATKFGAACPQYASSTNAGSGFVAGEIVGNEDCLFLNVYAPEPIQSVSEMEAERLPVMFWIHGGGNTSGTTEFYNGSRLANEHQMVVVTINYRLGFLGWFRHKALRADADSLDASGNFGTLDQILALDWVQQNISAFGGDANNVTIFGESAGGWNVLGLLASPLANGKFHRAIAQSSLTWSFSQAKAENYLDDTDPGVTFSSGETILRLAIAEGFAADRAGAKDWVDSMDDASLSRFLRDKPLAELFSAYQLRDSEVEDGYTCPRLFEDGVVLPAKPLAHAFRPDSQFNRVPVMLGTNKDEEKLFLLYNPEYTSQIFGLIPTFRDRGRYLRDAETITRIWRMMAVDHVAVDLSAAMPGKVFSYRFDWDEQPTFLWSDLGALIGAAHGFEIPFVFGHWNLGPSSNRLFDESNRIGREALSRTMMSYWAQFAATGDPGRGRDGNLPEWTNWSGEAPDFVVLDTQEGGGVRMNQGRDTTDAIISTILSDSSYRSLERRCTALASIHNWAPMAFSTIDYASVGEGLCHEFEIDGLIDPL